VKIVKNYKTDAYKNAEMLNFHVNMYCIVCLLVYL